MSAMIPRLRYIADKFGSTLFDAVKTRESKNSLITQDSDNLIIEFSNADPTPGKRRTQWLVKTYIADTKFKLEDLGRAQAALTAFERFQQKLPVEQRELNHLSTLSDLENLVEPFIKVEAKARLERDLSSATGRELRRLEEWKARDESLILQEGEGLPTIAVPITQFAARWWGRGTKWCTASENSNVFNCYYEDAPLIVLIDTDGAKFQMFVREDEIQLANAEDNDILKQEAGKRWKSLKHLLLWAATINIDALVYIPTRCLNKKLCKIALCQDAIEFLPKKYRNEDFYQEIITHQGKALFQIPEAQITKELCRLAVTNDGSALEYVPNKYRTKDICHIAVAQCGWALELVSKKYQTMTLYNIAVTQSGNALGYVPKEYRTAELCHIAVEQHPDAYKHVPKKIRSKKLWHTILSKNGLALEDVPKTFLTEKFCWLAVRQNGLALCYVPEHYCTADLCRVAVEQNGGALAYVPTIHLTADLCHKAILENNGISLYDMPKKYRTPELCHLAVQQNWAALEAVPTKHCTLEICKLAVAQNGLVLEHLPRRHRTKEICCLAVEQNIEAIQYVPNKYSKELSQGRTRWSVDILKDLTSRLSSNR
jgi:hypothetical protein